MRRARALALAVGVVAAACGGGRMRVTQVWQRGTLVSAVAVAPTGELLVATTGVATQLSLRDASGRLRMVRSFGGPEAEIVAMAAGVGIAATVGRDATLQVFGGRGLDPRWSQRLEGEGTAIALVEPGLIATATTSGALCLRRARDGALLQCLVLPSEDRVLALAACGDRLAASTGSRTIVLSVPDLRIEGHQAAGGLGLAFAPGCARLVVATMRAATYRGVRRGMLRAEVVDLGKPGRSDASTYASRALIWWHDHAPDPRIPRRTPVVFLDDHRFAIGWEGTIQLGDARGEGAAYQDVATPGRVRDLARTAEGHLLVGAWARSRLDEPSLYVIDP